MIILGHEAIINQSSPKSNLKIKQNARVMFDPKQKIYELGKI